MATIEGPGEKSRSAAAHRRVGAADDNDAVTLLLLLDDASAEALVLQELTDEGALESTWAVPLADLVAVVREREVDRPRWVWDDTSRRYPPLLEAGVRVERCHDLRLCHAILRRSIHSQHSELARAPRSAWDGPRPGTPERVEASLFDEEPEEPLDCAADFAASSMPCGRRASPAGCVCSWRPSRPAP